MVPSLAALKYEAFSPHVPATRNSNKESHKTPAALNPKPEALAPLYALKPKPRKFRALSPETPKSEPYLQARAAT